MLLLATKYKASDATHDPEKLDHAAINKLSRMVERVLEMRYPNKDDLLEEAAKIIASRKKQQGLNSAVRDSP